MVLIVYNDQMTLEVTDRGYDSIVMTKILVVMTEMLSGCYMVMTDISVVMTEM